MKRSFARFAVLQVSLIATLLVAILVPNIASAQSPVTREMPFLPGQRVGISQGNNGIATHGGSLYYAIDFLLNTSGESIHGVPAVAAFDGIVNSVVEGIKDVDTVNACNGGWGNTVIYCESYQEAGSDLCERASHLREVFVVEGEQIKAGQVIGLIGTSGHSSAPYLHSQLQALYSGGVSIASWYHYTEDGSVNGPWTFEDGTWIDTQTSTHPCYSSPLNPCAILRSLRRLFLTCLYIHTSY